MGDQVVYTIALNNTSSEDTPPLACAVADAKLGLAETVVLGPARTKTWTILYSPSALDPDQLANTAAVSCSLEGYPNTLSATAEVVVDLFQPAIEVTKSAPALAKVGDKIAYTFTIENTSSADSPPLALQSVVDDVLGDVKEAAVAAGCDGLESTSGTTRKTCTFTVEWTVAAVDLSPKDEEADDPVINNVTVHFHPDGLWPGLSGHTWSA